MGDLNAGERSPAVEELLQDGVLRDSWAAASAHLTPEWGTFENYRPPRVGQKRIDWIVVTRQVEVRSAAINPARIDGAWPSDHLPVHAVVRVREVAPSV